MKGKLFYLLGFVFLAIVGCASQTVVPEAPAHTTYSIQVECGSGIGEHKNFYWTVNEPVCEDENGKVSCSSLGGPGFTYGTFTGYTAVADPKIVAGSYCAVSWSKDPYDWRPDFVPGNEAAIGRYFVANQREIDRFLSYLAGQ